MNSAAAILLLIVAGSLKNDNFTNLSLFVINHYDTIQEYTLRRFARESFTSLSSISDFIDILGFADFAEFKSYISQTNRIRLLSLDNEFRKPDSYPRLLKQISRYSPDLNPSEIKGTLRRISDEIHAHRRVFLLGAGNPNSLFLEFQISMLMMGKPVISRMTTRNIDLDLRDIGSDDLVILTSFNGTYINIYPERKQRLSRIANLAVITAGTGLKMPNASLELVLPDSDYTSAVHLNLISALNLLLYEYITDYGSDRFSSL